MGKELRSTNSDKRSSNATKGFASNSPVQQKFVSSKGGRKKVPKGLAKIDPERALEIRRMGGLKRQQILKELRSTNSVDSEILREEKNEQDSISSGNESSTQ